MSPSPLPQQPPAAPFTIPVGHVRFAVALTARELAVGHRDGWLTAEDAYRLGFLRRCDMGRHPGDFACLLPGHPDPAATGFPEPAAADFARSCAVLAGQAQPRDADIWIYLAAAHIATPRGQGEAAHWHAWVREHGLPAACATPDAAWLEERRREYLVARAERGEGMDWQSGSGLLGTDRPEEVDAALDRADPLAGVAVIGLALNHPDPAAILPRIACALAADDRKLLQQATTATAHVARLHHTVDGPVLDLLRRRPRGNEADSDLWLFVPKRRLPWWLWRYQVPVQVRARAQRLRWRLRRQ